MEMITVARITTPMMSTLACLRSVVANLDESISQGPNVVDID
jgi:hypothetical protein